MKPQSFMIRAFERAGIKPWSNYMNYLLQAKLSGALDLDPYLAAYRKDKSATPEELCERSKTPPRIIIGHIAGQAWESAHPESNILQALNHVDIVKTWIRQAKKPEGFSDRREFLRANGIIPIPAHQSLHFHQHVSAGKTVEGHVEAGTLPAFEADLEDTDDLPPMLPPASEAE